jgi:type IV pilus assembly protein PilB
MASQPNQNPNNTQNPPGQIAPSQNAPGQNPMPGMPFGFPQNQGQPQGQMRPQGTLIPPGQPGFQAQAGQAQHAQQVQGGQAQAKAPVQAPPQQPAVPAVAGGPPKRIGDILIEDGYITKEQLETALSEARATGMPVGAVLVKLTFVDEEMLGKALAKLHGLQYIHLTVGDLDRDVMAVLPESFIKRHLVVPLAVDPQRKRIEVAMARPDNARLLDEITLLTGFRPVPKVSTHKEILQVLDRFFLVRTSAEDAMRMVEQDIAKDEAMYNTGLSAELESEMAAEDAPVVQLVNSILVEAIEGNASDVHIEPQKERLLVRVRIDGILKEMKSIPKKMANAICSRVKVASGMDIAERRRPQDGRMKINVGSTDYDMRVNCMAVQFGEKIVIRILRPNATTGGLEKLGLTQDEIRRIRPMIKAPCGIILVTGPTGSGKTTTLYSAMREINKPEINISTIEDPIEYPLSGINQTQISHKAGLTFALCLRALLRQDPDVIMVGEIRDHETLEAAIHAALTGHLVLSTLHTNSTSKTVTRLLEMGAPPYMVSTAVVGILAQRLVRRVCAKCKAPYTPDAEELQLMGLDSAEGPVQLFKGTGCDKCGGSGYSGRVGLYEIMNMSREIGELVEAGSSTYLIQDMAVKQGMLTLGMDGKRKILAGLTTVEEVTRVLGMNLEEV